MSYDLAAEPSYWRSITTMFLLPTSQSPMDDTRIVQRRDHPTLRWSCYWAYWRSMTTTFLLQTVSEPNGWYQDRPASRSTYTTMILLLSLLAFNDDNVLTSDSLRVQWMRPGSSSVEINLHYDALTSAGVWAQWMLPGSNVEINPIESGWSPESTTMFLLQTSGCRHSLTRVEKNLLLSKFKVKTICIHVTEVIIVPRWRGKAL